LPSIEEQHRIVEMMTAVDEHIESLRHQLDVLQTTRKSVLHHLLNAGGEGWTETTLGEIAEWFSGGTPRAGRPEFYEDGTIPWVVIADMANTEIYNTSTRITQDGLRAIGNRMAPAESVLISMYATVGRPAYTHVPVATNQAIAWSIPDKSKVLPRFLLLIAQNIEITLSSMARGATQRNINRKMLTEFGVRITSLIEQQRIVDEVSKIDNLIQDTNSALSATQQLRSALLNKEIS
jgi:type I restriction enzyme S subunit